MTDQTHRSLSYVRLPRAYSRLDDDTFANQLLQLFGSSTEASRLAEPLLSDQGVTVAQYVRQHLSYTVYLLALAYEESPHLGYIVVPVARHLMTDQYLRGNYKRLEQVPNFPKSLVTRLEQLDRETWFSQPLLGSHVVFDSQQANGQDVPSPVTLISTSPYTSLEKTDLAKISTTEAPLSGQTYARVQIESSAYLAPGSKQYRRLEVLRLLARSILSVEEGNTPIVKQHFSLPAYTYTHKDKSYILLSPEISADISPEESGHHVCTLSQFITCRPDWWIPLSKQEKKASIFKWMACLAATVSFFHSLKVTHGDINIKRIYLLKNGENIEIILDGWHQAHAEPRLFEYSKKRPNMKSNKSFVYGMPESTGGDNSRPVSRAKNLSITDLSSAEASRLHDVKCLGEVFGELLLVLIGLTKDALGRLRKERYDWIRDMRAKENAPDWNPIFYPKANSTANSETSASSVTSEIVEVNVSSTKPPSSSAVSSSKPRNDSTDKLSKSGASKEPPSRPGSIFGGMFSKSKDAPKAAEPESAPKVSKSKMAYGIANKLASSIGSNATPTPPPWWLEELKLMYPVFKGETDRVAWNKHSDLIGNNLLPLISAMSLADAPARPRVEVVWKDLTRIVGLFFKGTELCCSAHDEQLKEAHDTLQENILEDLYKRGIADEEEESWEGVGWEGPERFGPKQIGRRGEGALGECLFD